MKERASSCDALHFYACRAPMSRQAPLPRRQPVGCHREQRVHVGRGLAVRTEGKPARLAERAQPVEDGVAVPGALYCRSAGRARRREVFPCAPVGSLRHGAALLVARPRALVESVAADVSK